MNRRGRILTFYSYKGGVGRTMALANVGYILAVRKFKVLAIDWDLEAPGLHHYFPGGRNVHQPGLIDHFLAAQAAAGHHQPSPAANIVPSGMPSLDLLTAGCMDSSYPHKVASFDWVRLFNEHRCTVTGFGEFLTTLYDFVLIDSRTGVSDTAGICTAVLPDKLVTLFAPNEQNRIGLTETLPRILQYRRSSPDERPLIVFPVPSRFDQQDLPRHQGYLQQFRQDMTRVFRDEYGLESCDLRAYFNDVLLPYIPYYSYGERIVADSEEPDYPGSLRAAYQRLTDRLLTDVPWLNP